MYCIEFKTPRKAANAFERYLEGLNPNIESWAAFPYNHNEPDTTTWWVIRKPKAENPAYHLGKFDFRFESDIGGEGNSGSLFCGFLIEKGLGKDLEGVYNRTQKQKNLIMRDGWQWHSFFDDLLSSAFYTQFKIAIKRR